jgi:hypothetical protein
LANLPAVVRVTLPEHRLYDCMLPVHGWHHLDGEIHLLVSLPDGSRGYFPAAWTAIWGRSDTERPHRLVSAESIQSLRALVEALDRRRPSPRRST